MEAWAKAMMQRMMNYIRGFARAAQSLLDILVLLDRGNNENKRKFERRQATCGERFDDLPPFP
jgi:hypothetical protein